MPAAIFEFPKKSYIPKKKESGIYGLQNLENNKVYIGSAVSFQRRWLGHTFDLNRGKHRNAYLQNAFNKQPEAFEFYVIESVEKKELLVSREQFWIHFYESYDDKKGYNISPTAGSSLGIKRSPSSIERMRLSRLGATNPTVWRAVVRISDDGSEVEYPSIKEAAKQNVTAHANISSVCSGLVKSAADFKWRYADSPLATYKGPKLKPKQLILIRTKPKLTPEQRDNQSKGQKARYAKGGKHPMLGRKQKPESIAKIVMSKTQRIAGASRKAIIQMGRNGNEIARFPSIISAARHFNRTGTSCIRACMTGKKKTAYGFKWAYANP